MMTSQPTEDQHDIHPALHRRGLLHRPAPASSSETCDIGNNVKLYGA